MSPSPPPLTSMSSSSSERTLHDPESSKSSSTETTPLLSSKHDHLDSYIDSSSPLLEDGSAPAKKAAQPSKPLPKMQITLLCFARMMEPIAFFAIFPFIAQMVKRNGNLPDSDVGFYSGLIESMFSVVQVLVLIFWGRLSDSIGRKPVMVGTMVGMAIGTMAYTMATTIWQMILFRCLAGLFSGSTLVIRTMLSDHCTPETQAAAFSWFAFAGNIGIFLGPILGGTLADPVAQYPGVFGGIAFFEKYPYALVGIALTAVSIVGIVVSAVFLEETLQPDDVVSATETAMPTTHQNPSIFELLKAPGVAIVIWVYTHFMLLAFAFTAILPVVLFTPIEIGGVGFSSFQISVYMAIQGASQALWLILAFPFIQRRWGTKSVLIICGTVYPIFFAGFILINSLLRIGSESALAWSWVIGFVVAVIGPGVSMAFTGVQLAVNDVSPNPHVLGTLNAVAMTAASAIRSFVPGVATAVFAIGVRNQIFWGHLAWVVLLPIAMALRFFVQRMPDDKKITKDEE
ncbi:Efflux pump azaK [Cladobotryum mycophilum]|uniref:Efflux pump azaK n=1 Tax=Cladobotryum mycophilum TaxID=491253 RepID=A0ABR0SCJ0_9HYPO